MLLQEGIDLHSAGEAKQFSNLGFAEAIAPISLQRDSFEGRPRRILSGSDQMAGQFLRNIDGDSHRPFLILAASGSTGAIIRFMANIQIFGVNKSASTRAAERFFKERRVPVQMVDLKKKAIAAGEIKRFIDRFGWERLLDTEGKAYIDGGLKYLKLSEAELMQRIERDPLLLCLPLVRAGKLVSIGQDEESWKAMLALP